MNEKLFYLLALLTLLPLAPAQGMKKNTTGKKPRNRGIGEMASGLSFAFYCPWLIVFNYLKPSFQDERFPHGSVLGDANGPWSNILNFLKLEDLISLRQVNNKYYKIVGEHCNQSGWSVLKIRPKIGMKNKQAVYKKTNFLCQDAWEEIFDCLKFEELLLIKFVNKHVYVLVTTYIQKPFRRSFEVSMSRKFLSKTIFNFTERAFNFLNFTWKKEPWKPCFQKKLHSLKTILGDNQRICFELSSICLTKNNFLQYIAKLFKANLKSLKFSDYCVATDEHLKLIVKFFPDLQELNLEGCYKITDKSLLFIAKLKSLKFLFRHRYLKITDKSLEYIAQNLKNLIFIDLNHCKQITGNGLKHLANLPNLRLLWLCNCDQITDEDLKIVVQKIPNLQLLSLNCCSKVTDNGLEHIAHLSNLKVLSIVWCYRIAKKNVALLKKKNPNLEIIS